MHLHEALRGMIALADENEKLRVLGVSADERKDNFIVCESLKDGKVTVLTLTEVRNGYFDLFKDEAAADAYIAAQKAEEAEDEDDKAAA